MSNSRSR